MPDCMSSLIRSAILHPTKRNKSVARGLALGLAATSPAVHAVDRVWDGSTSDSWNTASNWTPFGTPTGLDTAVIANGDSVELTGNTAGINALTVGLDSNLNTNGHLLLVDNGGAATTQIVTNAQLVAAAGVAKAFDTDNLVIGPTSGMFSGPTLIHVDRLAINEGTIGGSGHYIFGVDGLQAAGPGLINDGVLTPNFFGSTTMRIEAGPNATLDLDGNTGGGHLDVDVDGFFGGFGAGTLIVDGVLEDTFDGTIDIGEGDTLEFTFFWGHSGTMNFNGTHADPATLRGGPATTFQDSTRINVTSGEAVFDARVAMNDGDLVAANGTTLTIREDFNVGNNAGFDLSGDDITVNLENQATLRINSDNDLDGNLSGSNVFNLGALTTLEINGASESGANGIFNGVINAQSLSTTVTFDAAFHVAGGGRFNFDGNNSELNVNADVTIDQGDFDLDGDVGINRVHIADNATLRLNTDGIDNDGVNDFGGELDIWGTLHTDFVGTSWSNSGQLRLNSGPASDVRLIGDDVINTGYIGGDGDAVMTDVAIQNDTGGTLSPGYQALARTWTLDGLTGELDLNEGGLLEMSLLSEFEHDRIHASDLDLGGTLKLILIDGYDPNPYVVHTLLTDLAGGLGALDGRFDAVEGIQIDPLYGLAVVYNVAAQTVTVQKALLGDANLNGQVEQGDLDLVLQNWGDSTNVGWELGDMTGNGQIEQGDLDLVLQHWGATAAPDFKGFIVPEPTAIVPMVLGAFAVAGRLRYANARSVGI